ncbi:hypothetical protein [Methanoregula sp.]|uniref:hypothetical protein n=1 Tax=Methanoregula sp. TaxID=2052170 RepID=UPI002C97E42D|nr:hypothetical protein [Methanoregula sp.]HVP97395.1 hypothetical protein [Methanoregula sp.]
MRVLAIGVGGAGGRITGALYANDRKSSKVTCVQALVIDVDSEALAQLKTLPDSAKIDFSSIDPEIPDQTLQSPQSGMIDIGEIIARVQNMERSETDAILLCCGLGGRMTDGVPGLIAALRESVTEPIFGLVTLPALTEGEKRSAKAAEDIDAIAPLLDGTILFDNETWLKKIAARRDALVEEISKGPGFLGLGRNQPQLTPEEITNKLLNQSIIRRISLLLRAGEFRADGGIELAEVVMDSSEVLNTIMGMGFISIGYAVEHLSKSPLAFLSRLRTSNTSLEQRKSAERIIELAKQAIYQEVSIPCDMTSAAKALILVAGPSHEISMKGFMTVRKWIDRSIAGMEMRSGDYPVTSAENVAIIVVLSGLENIPRVTELREIREQYRTGVSRQVTSSLNLPPAAGRQSEGGGSAVTTLWSGSDLRDDMIRLPGEKPKKAGIPRHSEGGGDVLPDNPTSQIQIPVAHSQGSRQQEVRPRIPEERNIPAVGRYTAEKRDDVSAKPKVQSNVPPPVSPGEGEESEHHLPEKRGYDHISSGQQTRAPVRRAIESGYEGNIPLKPAPAQRTPMTKQVPDPDRHKNVHPVHTGNEISSAQGRTTQTPETRTIIRRVTAKSPVQSPVPARETPVPASPHKTIIRQKKKAPEGDLERPEYPETGEKNSPLRQEELESAVEWEAGSATVSLEESKIGMKGRVQPTRDDIFLGKTIPLKEPLRVKDEALIHTEIKTKKIRFAPDAGEAAGTPESSSMASGKKKFRSSTPDDDRT